MPLIKKKNSSKPSFTAEELKKFKAMYDAVKAMEEDDDEEDDMEEEDDSEDTPAVIIMSAKKKDKMLKKS
jgi:hypothetical protein